MKTRPLFALFAALLVPAALQAWDYEGHRTVNQLALASLPTDFPAFVREPANAERVAFLAGEPDRWRNVSDAPIKHYNGLDHYCDLEQIPEAGLDFNKLPSLRYAFAAQFAAGRAAHPEHFPAVDQSRNSDGTREWPGFAPWAITEYYGKLKSAFSYLKVFEELGTPEEIANARADIIYMMGVSGHYVGDCAQPLHTTKHHNGWVGANPNGYTTASGIHSWIDGGFIGKAGIKTSDLVSRVQPAGPIATAQRPDGRDPVFVAVFDYLLEGSRLVEPLYQMEKAGKFSREKDQAVMPEGRAFIEGQLLKGGQMLGAIWLTAWKNAVPDTYLRSSLLKRQGIAAPTVPKSAP
jgi:hypothetical protein